MKLLLLCILMLMMAFYLGYLTCLTVKKLPVGDWLFAAIICTVIVLFVVGELDF